MLHLSSHVFGSHIWFHSSPKWKAHGWLNLYRGLVGWRGRANYRETYMESGGTLRNQEEKLKKENDFLRIALMAVADQSQWKPMTKQGWK